ncbi:MAG: DNA-directed RNA polymerase subunit omega [Lachnospiraceae bacterium]|nr:DNA-directed RNA polymerase subunit omega [Lachnospiraceae bacterium]MBR3599826.1 DNA-directed RNA polymerase subunit omega [Lachnospiraceae bacterium]
MLHPSYSDLMAVVNSEVEPGEQPVVQSRYSIVMATSKRARQIIGKLSVIQNKNKKEPKRPLTDREEEFAKYCENKKPLSMAVSELYEGKVKIVGDDE